MNQNQTLIERIVELFRDKYEDDVIEIHTAQGKVFRAVHLSYSMPLGSFLEFVCSDYAETFVCIRADQIVGCAFSE